MPDFLRWLRKMIDEHTAQGGDWRSVVDGIGLTRKRSGSTCLFRLDAAFCSTHGLFGTCVDIAWHPKSKNASPPR